MKHVLSLLMSVRVLVYIDDVLIYVKSPEQLIEIIN